MVRESPRPVSRLGREPPRVHPARPRRRRWCETRPMPVLDPNPQNGQKKMLLVFGSFFAIFIVIAVIASIASP